MNCWIVTMACRHDDLVIEVCESALRARKIAKQLDDSVPERIHELYGISSEPVCVKVIQICDGVPASVSIVREFEDRI